MRNLWRWFKRVILRRKPRFGFPEAARFAALITEHGHEPEQSPLLRILEKQGKKVKSNK